MRAVCVTVIFCMGLLLMNAGGGALTQPLWVELHQWSGCQAQYLAQTFRSVKLNAVKLLEMLLGTDVLTLIALDAQNPFNNTQIPELGQNMPGSRRSVVVDRSYHPKFGRPLITCRAELSGAL